MRLEVQNRLRHLWLYHIKRSKNSVKRVPFMDCGRGRVKVGMSHTSIELRNSSQVKSHFPLVEMLSSDSRSFRSARSFSV